jgi:hypothetical protein
MLRAIFVVLFLFAAVSAQAGTLENIRSSGLLQCGVDDVVDGFSAKRVDGDVVGMAADFCRAVAVAVIGDARKVNFNTLKPEERIEALQSGEIDVLVAAIPVDAAPEAMDGLLFAEPLYIAPGGEAYAAMVRQGDDAWFVAVRWVRHALLGARPQQDFGFVEGWLEKLAQTPGNFETIYERAFGEKPTEPNRAVSGGGWLWVP